MIDFISKSPVDKGWSGDRKYCVTDKDNRKYLLRISPVAEYERKKRTFEATRRLYALGVPMCEPVDCGISGEGVYMLFGWIDGEDAETVIPRLSPEKQYACGEEAGHILAKIHTLPAPEGTGDWEIRFNAKINRKIKAYGDCPIKYENGEAFITYINENRHLLANRPQVYQHGDYHIGNMMTGRDGKLYIIDFDRDDYGDPWEEFNRIVWCAQKAPIFASGMVAGYFDGRVPEKFWRLLALYIASNTLSSVPWAIPFGETEIHTMVNQAAEVLSWYDGMKNPLPAWYMERP